MPAPHSDLLARATTGDPKALEALVERHLPDLVTFVRTRAAVRLGRTEGATRMLLSRALARLARSLPRTGAAGDPGA